MKHFLKKLKKFADWMHQLKFDRRALVLLIVLDILMAFGSNIVDWPWLVTVAENSWYLTPFAPICSLYPLTLAIWFWIYYRSTRHGKFHATKPNRQPPTWFTTFIFIGITSYGIMSLIYFPLYMSWYGFQLQTVGNMLWVIVYSLQSLIILSELKPVPVYQYAIIIGYFAFKDFADRFLGTFIDTLDPNYPNYIALISTISIVTLHVVFITVAIKIAIRNNYNPENSIKIQNPELLKNPD